MFRAARGKARLAEGMLRGFVRREQAEEIVGDLLETRGRATGAGFWFALLRVVARFAWRPVTGLLLAVVVCVVIAAELFFWAAGQYRAAGGNDAPLLFRSMQFAHPSAVLGALAIFAFVRYGWRDRTWWLGAVYAGLCAGWVCALWLPWMRVELYAACVAAAGVSVCGRALRRSWMVMALSVAGSMVANLALGLMFRGLMSMAVSRGFLTRHFWIIWLLTEAGPLLVTVVLFGWLHRRLRVEVEVAA